MMKKMFVTYTENGWVKKAVITEDRYQELNMRSDIQNLSVYSDERLMEAGYTRLSSDNSSDNRKTLLG